MLIFADMVGGWVGVAIFQYIYILLLLLDWHYLKIRSFLILDVPSFSIRPFSRITTVLL